MRTGRQMWWWQRIALAVALLVGSGQGLATPVAAGPAPAPVAATGPCVRGTLPHGALSLICIPSSGWNGDLVVFAHGYVQANAPLDFQNLTLSDGTYLPDAAMGLGFAFATTSYRQNGLAVLEGVEDIRELVAAFRATAPRPPAHTYLTGASEGGLVAALLAERSPELFSGVLSLCGPIGDFRRQINYIGDFRVLFDYFFPGVLPGSPIDIPKELMDNWQTVYVPRVYQALTSNPDAALQLIKTAQASVDPGNIPATTVQTTVSLLWYSVFATNDAKAKLGGNPFGNLLRRYVGSNNDEQLNARVRRFAPSPVALLNMTRYQTSGALTLPLVTMHTTGDQIIPFWHQILYGAKARTSGRGSFTPIPIFRYGHCEFTTLEVLAGLVLVAYQASGAPVAAANAPARPNAEQARRDFDRAARADRRVERGQ